MITDTLTKNTPISKYTGYKKGDITNIVKLSGMLTRSEIGFFYPIPKEDVELYITKTSGTVEEYDLRLSTTDIGGYSGFTIYVVLEVTK